MAGKKQESKEKMHGLQKIHTEDDPKVINRGSADSLIRMVARARAAASKLHALCGFFPLVGAWHAGVYRHIDPAGASHATMVEWGEGNGASEKLEICR